jgi:hypothetical protein
MADNSPPHHMSEKIDKSLEEERAPKHAKTDAKSKTEILPPGTLAESLRQVRSRLPWSRAGGPGAAPVAPIHRDVGSAAVTAGVSHYLGGRRRGALKVRRPARGSRRPRPVQQGEGAWGRGVRWL